jgi:hypothetical protein
MIGKIYLSCDSNKKSMNEAQGLGDALVKLGAELVEDPRQADEFVHVGLSPKAHMNLDIPCWVIGESPRHGMQMAANALDFLWQRLAKEIVA